MTTEFPPPPSTPPYASPAPAPAKGSNGLAVAGFVLGLLGFLGSWIPVLNIVGLVLGVIGVILAAIGLAKSRRTGAGKGLAIAGLVLGGLAVVIAIIVNVAFVNAVDDAVNKATDTKVDAPAGSNDDGSDKAGTSRDNPAPVGSTITGGDWKVTINSVTTADSDSIDQKPAAGSTLLVVNLTATYIGNDEQGQSPWATVTFVSADGESFDSTGGSTLFIADKEFDSLKTVYQDGQVTGDQMIEVPEADWQSGVLAVSPDLMSDDTFVAVK
jgi:hypothetical protein